MQQEAQRVEDEKNGVKRRTVPLPENVLPVHRGLTDLVGRMLRQATLTKKRQTTTVDVF